ncbi:MAG: FKBP-type peptidyl-prolyl cis-trans isomerase [Deltaproteobacteria bacterium]|jgi:FKBP-type peptidyl-prolyl cis-trans isomerase FklB|nr:FKBP-type peptidyl-prolyl cis-trans isomerase [Deltaproteobacteria bacterium]
MKQIVISVSVAFLLSISINALAQDKPSAVELKNQKEKVSYIIGQNAGQFLKQQEYDYDLKSLFAGIEDVLKGVKPKMTDEEVKITMDKFKKDMWQELSIKNRQEGIEFLRKNRKRKGVIVTKSGLQYEIITAGTGVKPKGTDSVEVHYKGTLLNGKEFDSSYKNGASVTFPVTGVIPGWTEALKLMKKSAKWKLFIPSNLAYREYGAGKLIGPNSSLIFEIELLDIK